jgi:hypothetical protein
VGPKGADGTNRSSCFKGIESALSPRAKLVHLCAQHVCTTRVHNKCTQTSASSAHRHIRRGSLHSIGHMQLS